MKLKKIAEEIQFPYIPRSNKNNVWKRIQLKQIRQHFEKGFYNEEEYKKKVEEINKKHDPIKPRKN